MSGIAHRYVRRLIAWAKTPSDEEVAQQEVLAGLARRKRLARNVRNALLTEKRYPEWQGLRADDAEALIEDIRAIGAADPFISSGSVQRLIDWLAPCTFVRPKGDDEVAA
jgi:hypothetical protein